MVSAVVDVPLELPRSVAKEQRVEPPGHLLLGEVGEGDERELVGEALVEPQKVIVAALHALPSLVRSELVCRELLDPPCLLLTYRKSDSCW